MSGMALFSPGPLQRLVWDRRAHAWDQHAAPYVERVVDAVLSAAEIRPGTVAVDLGCGTGQLTLRLARSVAEVTAVDVSKQMIDRLRAKATSMGLVNIVSVVSPIERFELPAASVDLVISNYALHHLRNRDKQVLVKAVVTRLRPGGRFVVGDMMFGRGTNARDRAIIASKVVTLARRGLPGWWRVLKNVGRFGFRVQEHPVTMETWSRYFEQSGLSEVSAFPVVSEAGVVLGTKPSPGPAHPSTAGAGADHSMFQFPSLTVTGGGPLRGPVSSHLVADQRPGRPRR
jgi:ubiquinone/menaquinone biosynthesis C-methylase UbiE